VQEVPAQQYCRPGTQIPVRANRCSAVIVPLSSIFVVMQIIAGVFPNVYVSRLTAQHLSAQFGRVQQGLEAF